MHADPIAAVLEQENGKLLFRGKVVDLLRRTTEGFLRGSARIEGLDDFQGDMFAVEFQNDVSIANMNGEVMGTVHELSCVRETEAGEAIGTEALRYGQRVTAIALPAPPVLMTEKGLRHVGPRAFGFDLEFRSVFDGAPSA